MELLLDLSSNTQLAVVLSFFNRVILCKTLTGQEVLVYYPGSARSLKKPSTAYYVLIRAYDIPRPTCTHYLVCGDARIHSFIDQSIQHWVGFTTLYNNQIFKKVLDDNLWLQPFQSYRQQVKLNQSRIDFVITPKQSLEEIYLEVKADFVLWFNLKNSRLEKHLMELDQQKNSLLVFVTPYAKGLSFPFESLYCQNILYLLSTYSNISFYRIFVTYDKAGKVWFNSIENLT
jgi:DNA-binding sugar fermentation-stimulating protein